MTAKETDAREEPSDMEGFSSPSRTWMHGAFGGPTRTQVQAWRAIRSGENALVVAPTGSGKTLAAFMWAIDRLALQKDEAARASAEAEDAGTGLASSEDKVNEAARTSEATQTSEATDATEASKGVKVLYISPLKALGVDVERNLAAPLAGVRQAALAAGETARDVTVQVRSGDTPASERRRQAANPPDILITTPESLYLLLTSKAQEGLKTVHTVIVDEVHALAGNKRGAHLALSLERLDQLLQKPAQRIGLSATVEPPEEVARFLGGAQPVTIVQPKVDKQFDITVHVPVEDMANPPLPENDFINADSGEHRLGSMWPAIENSLYERISSANSTIVFTNSRRLSERLTAALNKLHAEKMGEDASEIARSHHGSVSKEARLSVEEALKDGSLKCVVATSSLELGIDMGSVDLVIQVDPPPSVASGLQRLGRSGHQVGAASKAVFYPTHRSKLPEMAAIVSRMRKGEIEPIRVLSNPLDVLAQQTVAAAASGPLDVEQWLQAVRRAAPYSSLPRSAYLGVLDLISGRYPSTEFSHLRARVDWDRQAGNLVARPGAKRLAVTSGGTIPDRGMYRVTTGEAGGRVGELDEEMVYETRVGEVFTLGTTPWRVRQITKDAVEVEPAFGQVGKVPFWRGDSPARPYSLGVGLGNLSGRLVSAKKVQAESELTALGFDENAANNTLAYLHEQVEAVGRVPSSGELIVERTRDDVGDWQYILQSPLGLTVHGPWALAINARLQETWGLQTKAVPSNDGIIVRVPDMEGEPPSAADIFAFDAGEIEQIIHSEVENSALFAARFREVAARALILGSSLPGKRSPLWQQRLRASALLEVAARYPDFPMILETMREVLQDVYDTGALTQVMRDLGSRKTRLVEVTTETPSPFARSLLFGYVGEFVYEGDTPRGERRLAALSVDPEVLRELLGEVPMKDLLEGEAIQQVEAELQRTKAGWGARDADGVVDLLRRLGPLTEEEIARRVDETVLPRHDRKESLSDGEEPGEGAPESSMAESSMAELGGVELGVTEAASRWVEEVLASRKAYRVLIHGAGYVAAVEDAGLLAQCGVPAPSGIPAAFLQVEGDGLEQLLTRLAATRGPFTTEFAANRFGVAPPTVENALQRLSDKGVLSHGRFLPDEILESRADQSPETSSSQGMQHRSGGEWVNQKVLARLRSRSLALLRGAVEPVPKPVFAQFLGRWQHCGGALRGADGTYAAIEQLAGVFLPASTWETLVLTQRVADYEPAFLDTLVAGGEVYWVGSAPIGRGDGWITFYPAQVPSFTLPQQEGEEETLSDLETQILGALQQRGALFASALLGVLEGVSAEALADGIWDLVWKGKVTGDTVTSLRAKTAGRRASQKTPMRRPRSRGFTRTSLLARQTSGARGASGLLDIQPSLAGRWSLTSDLALAGEKAAQRDATTWVASMLERYGVVTRGEVSSEEFPGGFAAAYRLLSDFEVAGACQRGYFVDGLGGAQFAIDGAVDYLRSIREEMDKTLPTSETFSGVLTLATTDPANPYGAGLAWPEVAGESSALPKRSAGSLVVLVEGRPALYLERGGRTALEFGETTEAVRNAAAKSLVDTARRGSLATFTIQKIGGEPAGESAWAPPLLGAGFERVPRGLILRRSVK